MSNQDDDLAQGLARVIAGTLLAVIGLGSVGVVGLLVAKCLLMLWHWLGLSFG